MTHERYYQRSFNNLPLRALAVGALGGAIVLGGATPAEARQEEPKIFLFEYGGELGVEGHDIIKNTLPKNQDNTGGNGSDEVLFEEVPDANEEIETDPRKLDPSELDGIVIEGGVGFKVESEAQVKAFKAALAELAKKSPFNPMDTDELADLILENDKKPHHAYLTPDYVAAQFFQESGFDPKVSSKYADGLCQFTPETAEAYGVEDVFEPKSCITGYYKLMNANMEWAVRKYPDKSVVHQMGVGFSAYNAGLGSVKKYADAPHYGLVPYKETNNYRKGITNFAAQIRTAVISAAGAPDADPASPEGIDWKPNNTGETACAEGSRSVGFEITVKGDRELCAITGYPSTSSESQAGTEYSIPGADGETVVVADASRAWATLVKWSKEDAAYLGKDKMVSSSAHRSEKHQAELCNGDPSGRCQNGDYTFIAPPGGSWHEKGANDLWMNGAPNSSDSCNWKKASGVKYCDYPGESKLRNWMMVNAPYVGLKQYANEYWHYDMHERTSTIAFDEMRRRFMKTAEGKVVPNHGSDVGQSSTETKSEIIIGQDTQEQGATLPGHEESTQPTTPTASASETATTSTHSTPAENQNQGNKDEPKKPRKGFWGWLGFGG